MRIDGSTPMGLTPAASDRSAELRKAAEGFESIFLSTLMKSARAASLGEDLMGGQGVDSARDMLDTELSRIASSRSGLGVAQAIERQFTPYLPSKG